MVIKWDKKEERYYIQPNKAKIYIDDTRSSEYKPSQKYLKSLEKLLKEDNKLKERIDKMKTNTENRVKKERIKSRISRK